MRYIIAFVAALAWLIPAPTSAQIVTLPAIVCFEQASVTNFVAGAHVIDCRRQQNVAIEWTFKLDGVDTSGVSLRFVPVTATGVRSTSTQLGEGFLIVRAANNTTPVTVITNFNVKGYSFLELHSQTNDTLQIVTNYIRYSLKPNAP